MTAQREVTVSGVRLRFAASHMATLGDELEPLHGHNYQVTATVRGSLTRERWVIDFSALKLYVRRACEALDHRFLLQARSELIEMEQTGGSWLVTFGGRRYQFPEADVVALPIENSTAELLAEWIATEVRGALAFGRHSEIHRLRIEVEEMPGQSASYETEL